MRGFKFRQFFLILSVAICATANVFSQNAAAKVEAPETSPAKVSYGLVIDNSGSYRLLLESVITFAKDIIDEQSPDDEAFLVRFVSSDKIALEQDLTSVKTQLHDAVENMYIEGGQTAIIDAINFSAKHLNEKAPADRLKALVLVTDGDERASASKFEETIQLLKKSGIRVLVVGLADGKLETKLLDKLARETGGRFMPMKNRGELRAAAKEVAVLLRKP